MLGAAIALPGCLARKTAVVFNNDLKHYEEVATQIEYADTTVPSDSDVVGQRSPRTLSDPDVEYWELPLQEVVHLALLHSRVMRDLGATVLLGPQGARTNYDPAIQESDPLLGVEAALSAFDAQLAASFFAEKNDRRLNNRFLGDLGFFDQDLDVFQAELSKRAATGSKFALRHAWEFDRDNSLANQFAGGAWTVKLEGEARQPLLQGAGSRFNRIAGVQGRPGVYDGVVVARIKTDISLAEFQAALRDFISNVENAYWDLYFAYRDLDTKIRARDAALATWRQVKTLYDHGRAGGEADKEAQAREQYFRFQEEVQNALAGRLLEGTRTNNGSRPGTFRGIPGVQLAERRLRLLIGLPANGEQLIRPAGDPPAAPVVFDWSEITADAMALRAELRRQRWEVKRREMELIAAKNFLLPNLDLVGLYRWRGFGHDLIDAQRSGRPRFDNAYMDLTSGDFQEWQLGVEYSVPIGLRRGHTAVRNAQLRLSRNRALLREQERQVVHDLSNAVADVDRAYAVVHTNYNRMVAARQQVDAVQASYNDRKVEFFVILDAQRRQTEAESRYYLSRVEYALAHRNVHFEKGTLLEYCGVSLSEGQWPRKAYLDAARREATRGRHVNASYAMSEPPIVSRGTHPPVVRLPATIQRQHGQLPVPDPPDAPGLPENGGPEPETGTVDKGR